MAIIAITPYTASRAARGAGIASVSLATARYALAYSVMAAMWISRA